MTHDHPPEWALDQGTRILDRMLADHFDKLHPMTFSMGELVDTLHRFACHTWVALHSDAGRLGAIEGAVTRVRVLDPSLDARSLVYAAWADQERWRCGPDSSETAA